MNNFEFTGETKVNLLGITLFRIRATVEIKKHNVKVGDLGGWISEDIKLSENAWVSGDAQVSGDARVYGNARVSGNDRVSGDAQVSGDARVYGNDQWCCFNCFGSENRTTTAYTTKTGIEIVCGCFKGDLKEFIAKVQSTHGDSKFGREYMAMIELIKIKFDIKDSEL